MKNKNQVKSMNLPNIVTDVKSCQKRTFCSPRKIIGVLLNRFSVAILGSLGIRGLILSLSALPVLANNHSIKGSRPNVIVVITDDQGYGDFGCKGNPHLQTPHLDAMASRSFEMKRFYVSAVCSPTRASLMTGRDSYRTGVTDTWLGGSFMRGEEMTVAEILKDAGYATALFGKWHLGDNYPGRPMDQGFDHALYHMGGGLGQPSDPIENRGLPYTDPILFENGTRKKMKGFCCDIYFEEAIKWFKKENQNNRPFFAYIASNTPHYPAHDVPREWLKYYKDKKVGKNPLPALYAMISNIDENMGKLFNALQENELYEDTLVIYLNDNGPNTQRFVGGFSGNKGMCKEGGIRSPIWWHWPGTLKAGGQSDLLSAHIDILPTLADICGAELPESLRLDGRSIAPTLNGEQQSWDNRTIFIQSHRGERPKFMHNVAIIQQKWKIEGSRSAALFDMLNDPFAKTDVSRQYPERKKMLIAQYKDWIEGLDDEYSNMWEPIPIQFNAEKEPVMILTHQEWHHMTGGPWHKTGSNGKWLITFPERTVCEMRFNLLEPPAEVEATIEIDDQQREKQLLQRIDNGYRCKPVVFEKGTHWLKINIEAGEVKTGPWQIFLSKKM